jgi:hypothetical protein
MPWTEERRRRWEQEIKRCIPERSGKATVVRQREGLLEIDTTSGDTYSAKFLDGEGFELQLEKKGMV